MDNSTCMKKQFILVNSDAGTSFVIVRKEDVIEILKTLEGLKRKLQPLLK